MRGIKINHSFIFRIANLSPDNALFIQAFINSIRTVRTTHARHFKYYSLLHMTKLKS